MSPYIKKYEVSSAPVETLAIRQNDSSVAPGWKGGARVRWYLGKGVYGWCSSGFSVRYSRFAYMITAAHCAARDSMETQDGNGNTMGLTTNRTPGNDYLWIKVSRAAPRVYVGGWNSKSGAYRNVVGTVGNTKGSYTCQSGASTGTNCDTKIINENYLYKINGMWQWGVRAERQAWVRAIGTGDSGGPVLKNTSRSSDILAAGIISAGQVKLSCQGTVAPGTTCFKRVIYKRIQTARWSGTIVTR